LPPRDGRDLARRLLRRADGDIMLVRTVVDNDEILDAIIGFHAQQTRVEKSIKAVLAAHEIEYGMRGPYRRRGDRPLDRSMRLGWLATRSGRRGRQPPTQA
jgi:hypothetical protein